MDDKGCITLPQFASFSGNCVYVASNVFSCENPQRVAAILNAAFEEAVRDAMNRIEELKS